MKKSENISNRIAHFVEGILVKESRNKTVTEAASYLAKELNISLASLHHLRHGKMLGLNSSLDLFVKLTNLSGNNSIAQFMAYLEKLEYISSPHINEFFDKIDKNLTKEQRRAFFSKIQDMSDDQMQALVKYVDLSDKRKSVLVLDLFKSWVS